VCAYRVSLSRKPLHPFCRILESFSFCPYSQISEVISTTRFFACGVYALKLKKRGCSPNSMLIETGKNTPKKYRLAQRALAGSVKGDVMLGENHALMFEFPEY
ncbi:hypothetical protein, partial [Enterovibrio norvegicus]|uniref:hypothetical protein n=1 Tax=Enterovibrio norvegicus TaxID=188144 RepID=UPI00354B9E47